MKRLSFLVALMIALNWPEPARAYDPLLDLLDDGNGFLRLCEEPDNIRAKSLCYRLVQYVWRSAKTPYALYGLHVCSPDGVKLKQVVVVVKMALREHPEDGHLPAPRLIARAISKAWPCPKKKPLS